MPSKPSKPLKAVEVRTGAQWRAWLAEHHDSESEVWLIFQKRHTGRPTIAYEDGVDEALCFGWIDSLIRRLDDARYARKFTPRKPGSRWSTANRRRYAQLKAAGRLTAAGLKIEPTERSGDAPRPPAAAIPRYILDALRNHPAAWSHFKSLAPSYRRMYIGWVDSAKMRRLEEAISLLAAGRKLGLK
jgi:uncharacterized protein YdeI (YjbR/CyaY-like superfamily)